MNNFRRPLAPRRPMQQIAHRRVVQPFTPPSIVMNHDKYVAITAHSKFKPGDLCWARLDAHRIWPALIMDPSNRELQRYPFASGKVLLFVNFLVVDYHAFLPETDIWDYKTGSELFSKTNAARTKSLTEAVNNLKRMSETPTDASVDDANSLPKSNEFGQTSGEKVDVYEFQDDDLNSEEQITPGHQRFSQAGRKANMVVQDKANMVVQDIQSNQLNHLEPKVILERSAEDKCAEKGKPVKTNARGEHIADNEATAKDKKDEKLKMATKIMNSETNDPKKSVVKQGKPTKVKKNAKELADEYVERKKRKLAEIKRKEAEKKRKEAEKKRMEAEKKGEIPVETARKIVMKRKNQQNVEEQEEKAEKIVKKKKVEVPVKKTGITPKKSSEQNVQKVEGVSVEKIIQRSRSGRVLRKTELFQIVPSVRKPREKNNLSAPTKAREAVKGEIQIQKRNIEPERVIPNVESIIPEPESVIPEPESVIPEPESVIPEPESIFNTYRQTTAVQLNRMNPHISLQNMPQSVLEKFHSMEERRMVSDAKFGFVGLGSLGKHLARRLLLSGHKVYLWDRSPWKCYDFVEHAKVLFKDSLEELVKECSTIFICITDGPAVQSIITKNRRLLKLLKGKGVVNFSTMECNFYKNVKRKVERYGGMYLTVSLIESTDNRVANNYTALVSGNEKLLGDCLTCIAAMSNYIYYMDFSSWALDYAQLLSGFTPCFHANSVSFFNLYKQQNLSLSNIRRSYEVCVMDPDSDEDQDTFHDPELCNYLPPKAISLHLKALLRQVGKTKWVPTLACLNEMYSNSRE